MIAGLLALAALAAQSGGQRWNPATVVFEGPLERARFEQGAHGATEVSLGLVGGERRVLQVPFVHRPLDPAAVPAAAARAGGARFEGWSAQDPWGALPAGLRVRSRPIPPEPPGGAPGSGARTVTLLALVATAAGVLGLRRRPLHALAAGLLGAATAGALEHGRPPAPAAALRVLEGQAGGTSEWLAVTAARDQLLVDASVVRLETVPAGVPLHYAVAAEPGSAPTVTARVRGARILTFAPLLVRGRVLAPDLNAWGPLEAVWTRSAAGVWTAHGAWGMGEALPPVRSGAQGAASGRGQPPGWAAAGLPQGTGVLVAVLGRGAWAAGGADVTATWIRLLGF